MRMKFANPFRPGLAQMIDKMQAKIRRHVIKIVLFKISLSQLGSQQFETVPTGRNSKSA